VHASTETVQTLMEIALMAGGHGRVAEAQAICIGLQVVRPESELPAVALAIAQMNAGRHTEAAELLRSAVIKNPESDTAMSMLGFALRKCGLMQASRDVAQQVVDANNDPQAVGLAKAILETRD